MTEQQGWTAPQATEAERATEGTAAAPQHSTSPHAPATPAAAIPHQAAPVSGAAWHAPCSGGTAGAAPTAGTAVTPAEGSGDAPAASYPAAPVSSGYSTPTTNYGYPAAGYTQAPAVGYSSTAGYGTAQATGSAPATGSTAAFGATPGYGPTTAPGPTTGSGYGTGNAPGTGMGNVAGNVAGGHLPPQQPMPPHAPHMNAPHLNAPAYSLATAHHAPGHLMQAPHKRSRVGIAIAAVLAAIALSGGSAVAGGYAVTQFEPRAATSTVSTTTASRPNSSGTTQLSDVAAAVLPSVVSINTGSAIGSGVILTADGNILTNNHVVATAQGATVQVSFSNGKTGTATIVGTNPTHDLAVIKVQNVSGLTPIVFADSSQVKVGDTVLAVGSPLGLTGSVTAGIVSALNRTIDEGNEDGSKGASIDGALQTDAAINPGNSGGALVNSAGQLIGINTAIASASQQESGNIGVGFAISSNTAKQVSAQIMGH